MTTGVFENEARAKQLVRYDGMNMGNRCFTDFDAVLEWRNVGWLVFEVKYGNKWFPTGQRLALERLVRDASCCGKFAVAAVVEHQVANPADPVYLKDCLVRSVYVTGEYQWRAPKHYMNAHNLMREFVSFADMKANESGQGWPLSS